MSIAKQSSRGILAGGKRLETLWIEPVRTGRPALVLLHEGLGSIALWKGFPQQLAARTGCGVLVYSRYGHGNSDKLMESRPVEFMHHEGEVVLPEVLEQTGIAMPILLGHSDGGSIALIFAGKYPQAVSGLILEAPHVFVEDLTIASIEQARETYRTTDLGLRLGRYHAHVEATFWGWNDQWLDPNFRSWNIEDYLGAIRCPILCIQGEDDEYGTRAQVDAIHAQTSHTEVVMLSNCKHSPHRDQTEKTLQLMAKFVADVERGEADKFGGTRTVDSSVSLATTTSRSS
jgi:pimeloyl-ACP methyl ester carboxylesterase